MNKQQIKELALAKGFKLKEQPSGEMDLNPYVYEFANALLAKANERVEELETFNKELRCAIHQGSASVVKALLKKDKEGEVALNKFAIENQVKALEDCVGVCGFLSCDDSLKSRIKQLRKEQDNE